MLIFDNSKHYELLLSKGFEKYPNKRDLMILCEEWIKQGSQFEELQNKMVKFCAEWNSQFNEVKSEGLIKTVLNGIKNELEKGKSFEFSRNLVVYKSELDTILSLADKKEQKILFIMICLAKWRNANYIYLNSDSSIKLRDIFSLAQVKGTKKEQFAILHDLNTAHYISTQLRPILKCVIPCIAKDGEVALQFEVGDTMITNFLNVIMPHCCRCGKPFEKHNNKQKYCKECAKLVKQEQNKTYLIQKGK